MARRRRSGRFVGGATRVVVARPAATPTIRIATPAPITRRSARRYVGHAARRAGSAALSEKHTLVALGASAVLGYVEKHGIVLPRIPKFSTAATYGVGAWLYGRYGKNRTAQHVATGLLCCALRDLTAGRTTDAIVGDSVMGTGVVYGEDVEGDDED